MNRHLYLCLVAASAVTVMISGFAIGSELRASMQPNVDVMLPDDLIVDS